MSHVMSRLRAGSARQGFTLIEVLAALAIASVIVMATVALMHNVVLTFDRGTNRVSAGERLALAADRLAADIGSARFVLQGSGPAALAAFVGAPTKITFIGTGIIDPASRQEGLNEVRMPAPEVISIALEAGEETTAVVRRRGAWRDPRARLTDAALGDEVVLLAGRFDAAFSFARLSPEGKLTWSSSWSAEKSLPRLVKLTVRDRASGIDLLGGAEFLIRADASRACTREGANLDCITNPGGPDPAAPANPQAPNQARGRRG
jgi:prepilin-type N-terminal cleavage/methylation domain-containing protein